MLCVLAAFAFFPRVEDPWPDEIGILFPFTVAGAAGTIAQFVVGDISVEQRDRAVRRSSRWGLLGGSAFYLASLLAQVVF